MKFLRQFCIILVLSFMGEVLKSVLPLPIPASVWGLLLMLAALKSKILKVSQVGDAASFMIEIMPVMFIPAGVGLLTAWGVLKPVFLPVIVITVLSTVIVMGVTGTVTQAVIRREKRRQQDENAVRAGQAEDNRVKDSIAGR